MRHAHCTDSIDFSLASLWSLSTPLPPHCYTGPVFIWTSASSSSLCTMSTTPSPLSRFFPRFRRDVKPEDIMGVRKRRHNPQISNVTAVTAQGQEGGWTLLIRTQYAWSYFFLGLSYQMLNILNFGFLRHSNNNGCESDIDHMMGVAWLTVELMLISSDSWALANLPHPAGGPGGTYFSHSGGFVRTMFCIFSKFSWLAALNIHGETGLSPSEKSLEIVDLDKCGLCFWFKSKWHCSLLVVLLCSPHFRRTSLLNSCPKGKALHLVKPTRGM